MQIIQKLFKLKLQVSNFSNYEEYVNINKAYNDFSDKLLRAINEVASLKEIRVKSQNQ